MNREETHALFAQGKEAWNAWANDMLAKKKVLQDAGKWTMCDLIGGPLAEDEAVRAWFAEAEAEFSTPDIAHFFAENTSFRGWIFPDIAVFDGATFAGQALFEEAIFEGNAWFKCVIFIEPVSFRRAAFKRGSNFAMATFTSEAHFHEATFGEVAWFDNGTFKGTAFFQDTTFSQNARFDEVSFKREVFFDGATFAQVARFKNAVFASDAGFTGAAFHGPSLFTGTTFKFGARFAQSSFKNYTTFQKASFEGPVVFTAISSERALTLADASFRKVPDFIQASFCEAPRFDNVRIQPGYVEGSTFSARLGSRIRRCVDGDRDVPARWRALKRLAIQGHDREREQLFFPKEIRSARFVTDWPLPFARMKWSPPKDKPGAMRPWFSRIPIVPWRKSAWTGFFRFWFGALYQMFSDFGRSILRPTLAFLAVALVCAAAYLGVSESQGGNTASPFGGRLISAASQSFASPGALRAVHPCVTVSGQNLRSLEPEMARRTDALSEAMHLSWTNGSIVGGLGGLDSARRTYGCLYGFVEDGGQNATPVLPAAVSIIATWQKTLSVIMIFLFGLAIRNMLKMH